MPKSNPQPSRRDLLGGFGKPENQGDSSNVGDEINFGPLFHFSSNAMGCEFQILCSESGRQPLAACVANGFQLIEDLESQLSIYRESSELSQINRSAFHSRMKVESQLFELMKLSNEIHVASDGAFDLTATPLSRLWKRHRNQRLLPKQSEIEKALKLVDGSQINLELIDQSVRFGLESLTIDLGGIGKGYALDRLREFLLMSNCENFLIHGGQSSVIGSGVREAASGDNAGQWQVGISHPLNPGVRLAVIDLNDRAIGTSGSGRQSVVVNGKRYGHIIDPRTGWPAEHYLSVTVLASTAILADALATAIFVAGPKQAERICAQFEVSAILISENEDQTIDLKTVNLSDEEMRIEQA